MPLIPTDPSSWSLGMYRVFNYFVVASSVAVVYDWVLTFGQEYELIWRQRRSFMTVLYISVRYVGILYSVGNVLLNLPGILTTDMFLEAFSFVRLIINWALSGNVMNLSLGWAILAINPMLNVILISRLHAMYQQSRKMLIFLIVTYVSITITCGVIAAVGTSFLHMKAFLYATQCVFEVDSNQELRMLETYTVATAWEVLSLCLALWIVVKHLRELRPQWTGRAVIGDYFTVLLKSHVLYFAFYAAGSCFNLGMMSPKIMDSSSAGAQIYRGILELVTLLQMFVVGPRLILSIREYHAKFVAGCEGETHQIPSIAFQEHIEMSTGSDV